MLLPGWVRTAWMVGAAAIVIFGVVFTATRLNLSRFDNELRFRGQAHADLTEVLERPAGQGGAALRAADRALTTRSSRTRAGSPGSATAVLAREWVGRIEQQERDATRASRRNGEPIEHPDPTTCRASSHEGGVAIVVTSRFAIFKHAWSDASDDARIQLPPPGFERVKTTRFYAAYVRC